MQKINFNLLRYLEILVSERSVSQAAQKAGLSQPAMSIILSELRKVYKDPLLVRGGGGMIPTAKSLELVVPLREGLDLVRSTLTMKSKFDPKTDRKTFKIVVNDYIGAVFLPYFFKRMKTHFPNLRFEMMSWGRHNSPKSLISNDLDLMIGFHHQVPEGFYEETLFEEHFVCLVRKGHPTVKDKVSLDQFLKLKHMKVQESEGAIRLVDAELDKLGKSRDIELKVPHFLAFPFILAKTDMIITTSNRIAKQFSSLLPLKIVQPPLKLPGAVIKQVWHERVNNDPAQIWLRSELQKIGAKI